MIVTMKTVSSGTGAGAYYIEGTLDKQLPEQNLEKLGVKELKGMQQSKALMTERFDALKTPDKTQAFLGNCQFKSSVALSQGFSVKGVAAEQSSMGKSLDWGNTKDVAPAVSAQKTNPYDIDKISVNLQMPKQHDNGIEIIEKSWCGQAEKLPIGAGIDRPHSKNMGVQYQSQAFWVAPTATKSVIQIAEEQGGFYAKCAESSSNSSRVAQYYDAKGTAMQSWKGEGAKALGLLGKKFDGAEFSSLLKGEMPDGSTMHTGFNEKGEPTRRGGYDFMHAAPKSVSVLYGLTRDVRILDALNTAMDKTVTHFEQHHTHYRQKTDGQVTSVKSNNIIASCFTHFESRELDPHLHTHMVLINATQTPNGYRALDGNNFFKEGFHQQLGRVASGYMIEELGKYYSIKLAKEGYEVDGVPKELCQLFSKRNRDISQLKEAGFIDQQAHKRTLKNKNHLSINEHHKNWVNEVKDSPVYSGHLDKVHALYQSSLQSAPEKVDPGVFLDNAIYGAMNYLTLKSPCAKVEEVVHEAQKLIAFDQQPLPEAWIKHIEQMVKAEKLLYDQEGRLTTPHIVDTEKQALITLAEHKQSSPQFQSLWSKVLPSLGDKFLKAQVQPYFKHHAQSEFVKDFLGSKERFCIINSDQRSATHQFARALKAFSKS